VFDALKLHKFTSQDASLGLNDDLLACVAHTYSQLTNSILPFYKLLPFFSSFPFHSFLKLMPLASVEHLPRNDRPKHLPDRTCKQSCICLFPDNRRYSDVMEVHIHAERLQIHLLIRYRSNEPHQVHREGRQYHPSSSNLAHKEPSV